MEKVRKKGKDKNTGTSLKNIKNKKIYIWGKEIKEDLVEKKKKSDCSQKQEI